MDQNYGWLSNSSYYDPANSYMIYTDPLAGTRLIVFDIAIKRYGQDLYMGSSSFC